MTEEERQQIEQDLQRFLEGKSVDEEVRDAVRKSGLSANRGYIPLLKEIAALTSKNDYRKLTFDALHSLWQLNEPRDYFLASTLQHQQNKWLAYHSILILGRNPNDQEVLQVLTEIKTESADNQIRGAIAEAERVRSLAIEYAKLNSAEQKCDFILSHFRSGWNPVYCGDTEFEPDTSPLAIWSQQELYELSKEDPEVVAEGVSKIDLSEDFDDFQYTKSYQDHVAQFLSKEARVRLQDLANK